MELLEQKIICTTHVLDNGLTVWLNEDHTQPKVFGAVVVNAGAKECPNTGIAHYFEHMMFKGTDNIGTVDYEKEKVLLDCIERKYDQLAQTRDERERKDIQQEINRLNIQAAEYVIPNEFEKLISRYGGTKLNAGTSFDYTVYYNTFSPQYMEQWAEINSERLLHPVFRLFQNELETVYEEKNMYSDQIGGISVDYLKERYFSPHPYAYPVIGSTENLKNPRLSEMRKFFDDYYVASNMGLILSGDFSTSDVLPVLERTFSRIRKGSAPKIPVVSLPEFRGKEQMKLKVPMPFVKMMAMCFRGVPASHPDEVALRVALSLLNNTNGTGLLDRLTIEHKVTAAVAYNDCMNEAGILAIFVMPKLLFQSYSSAEELVWKQIACIQNGDFSDDTFQSLKLEQKREYMSALEDISSRAHVMMRLFSQKKKWEDYLKEVDRINSITKEDVMAVANRYFTKNYLHVTKSTGRYKKDNLPKPDYIPISAHHQHEKSAYAKRLEQMPVKEMSPHFADGNEVNVARRVLSSNVTLYVSPNPVNDIFSLDIHYGIGRIKYPLLSQLANCLSIVGTKEESYSVFHERLRQLGSVLSFEDTDSEFIIHVSGFDSTIRETLLLVKEFMQNAKVEKRNIRQLKDEMKVAEKAFCNSNESLAQALFENVVFGANSPFLARPALRELGKMEGTDFESLFEEIQEYGGDVLYCGNLELGQVADMLESILHLSEIKFSRIYPVIRPKHLYTSPKVYFLDMKGVSQSIVCGYILGDLVDKPIERCASKLFSAYFGNDMSSLMFQEMREYRSYAYQVNGQYRLPSNLAKEDPGYFQMSFSTQSDKTLDAIAVLDGLIKNMPLYPEQVEMAKQNICNRANNAFPSFRDLPAKVAAYHQEGFDHDPNRDLIEHIKSLNVDDVDAFYQKHIKDRPVVYMIVGNSKRIDMGKLANYGDLEKLRINDIYNK